MNKAFGKSFPLVFYNPYMPNPLMFYQCFVSFLFFFFLVYLLKQTFTVFSHEDTGRLSPLTKPRNSASSCENPSKGHSNMNQLVNNPYQWCHLHQLLMLEVRADCHLSNSDCYILQCNLNHSPTAFNPQHCKQPHRKATLYMVMQNDLIYRFPRPLHQSSDFLGTLEEKLQDVNQEPVTACKQFSF